HRRAGRVLRRREQKVRARVHLRERLPVVRSHGLALVGLPRGLIERGRRGRPRIACLVAAAWVLQACAAPEPPVPRGLARPRARGTIGRLGFGARPLVSGRPAMARLQGPVLVGRETPPRRAAPAGGGHPNVVLYVVDTLRADRLGCYGGPRGTSPRLDAFAAGA